MNRSRQAKGFTLIELLVVIAIIALLISILLPALGKARKAGQMAVSMSNMRQLGVGMATYRDSNKDRLPLFVQKANRGFTTKEGDGGVGWVTWSMAGKNNAGVPNWMTGQDSFGDVEAADRPMNAYIYPEVTWDAPPAVDSGAGRMKATDSGRKQEAKVFKDPSDKIGHQQTWGVPNRDGLSCYDDVGSSYHYNAKWWDQLAKITQFVNRFEFGVKRMQLADSFNPAKFAWANDEYADITVNKTSEKAVVINGYGDANRSILGFLDGHAAYLPIYPGKRPISYTNDKYTFVFEDLKVPQ